MKRKVVQQGPATLMVSLPSKWVKENNVSKGDELDLAEEKGKIILTIDAPSSDSVSKEHAVVDFGVFNEYFVNYFYQKGYDEVMIRCKDPAVAALVEKRARELMGFEVVEKGKNFVRVKSLMKIDQQEFDTVLKKLFQITLVMGDKVTDALNQASDEKKKELLAEVVLDEKENNKYCDLCIRILFKNKYQYPDEGFAYFALLRQLEQVGDLYKYIARELSTSGLLNSDFISLYKRVHAYFRLYYDLFYLYDAEKAQLFFAEKDTLVKLCSEQMKNATKEQAIQLSYILTLTREIFDLKGPLFLMKV
ncbi:phosphate uptake regulator PhoU [Candidatus Woesearchaeota archaeon]|nr:phosphate uptake regulator PhoU [Candidatus Woesearchaeota archaeon]